MPVYAFGKGLHYVLTNSLHPYFKYTYKLTYTHTFGKTISVNQARTHSRPLGHGPDLKMEVGIDKSTDTRNGSITVSL